MFELAVLIIFPLAMLVSASMDILTMTIPNKVTLALVVGFFVLAPFVGFTWQEFGLHIAIGFAMLVITMGMFAMGWIGGGDAKLFAATGLWLGYTTQMFEYALYASLLGGVLTVLVMKLRMMPVLPSWMSFKWLERLHNPNEGVPYGVALAAAGLLIYPHTVWMNAI